MDLSICTGCMNRDKFIEEALPTWVKIPFKEIVIVDWSSKNPVKDIVDKYQNGTIKLVRVNDKTTYNHSIVSNLKVRLTDSEYVVSADCDVKLKENFLSSFDIKENEFYTGSNLEANGIFGTCLLKRDMFEKVGGYNEFMAGWGHQDGDLYNRLKREKYIYKNFTPGTLVHINHSNAVRVENFEEKDLVKGHSQNKKTTLDHPWDSSCKKQEHEVTIYYPNGSVELKTL